MTPVVIKLRNTTGLMSVVEIATNRTIRTKASPALPLMETFKPPVARAFSFTILNIPCPCYRSTTENTVTGIVKISIELPTPRKSVHSPARSPLHLPGLTSIRTKESTSPKKAFTISLTTKTTRTLQPPWPYESWHSKKQSFNTKNIRKMNRYLVPNRSFSNEKSKNTNIARRRWQKDLIFRTSGAKKPSRITARKSIAVKVASTSTIVNAKSPVSCNPTTNKPLTFRP